MREHKDKAIEQRIAGLHNDVTVWAKANDLWYDCGFFDYTQRVKPIRWDETGYVTVLAADGPIAEHVICSSNEEGSLAAEFEKLLTIHGFWYENYDHTEMWIYASDPAVEQDFKEYARWKWICSLIKPDFDILDEELYAHFSRYPDQLTDMQWREYELIVAALLDSQGYEVDPGTGRNGGVDITLLQRDPLGDIMTLVQARRYQPHRKIDLQAVQALHGATMAYEATNSIFVTTSTYLPSAKKFAARDNVPMELYTSEDVQRWCAEAHDGIVIDKRKLVDEKAVEETLQKARQDPRRILHSAGGYGMITNRFAVSLKETRTAALLLELPSRTTEHDGYGQRGREVPAIESIPSLQRIGANTIRRARRSEKDKRRFWDGENHYSPWTGDPVHFDYRD